MDDTLFRERAINLEETFFAQQNKELIQQLRETKQREEQRRMLAEALQIDNDKVLDHIMELELSPECVVAFTLVPLVEVAWADGHVDAKERAAIMRSAAERGIGADSISGALLAAWLEHKPPAALLDAWEQYVGALRESLSADEQQVISAKMLDRARAVAEAAGGFLGLGAKVSASEKVMLERLEKAWS